MKECILFCDIPDEIKAIEEPQDDLFGPTSGEYISRLSRKIPIRICFKTPEEPSPGWEISPILLHLIHPFALQNLTTALKHVKRYHQFLKSVSARVEKSQIAKDLLVDMIDCSGLNLTELETILDASIPGVEALQRMLVSRTLSSSSSDINA